MKLELPLNLAEVPPVGTYYLIKVKGELHSFLFTSVALNRRLKKVNIINILVL